MTLLQSTSQKAAFQLPSWPSSSGKQQPPCIPTPTSTNQARFCAAAHAAVIHRHLHPIGSNSSEATVVSGFHQMSTQRAPSRHVKVVSELASLQQCLSKPRSSLHEHARVLQPSFQTTNNDLQEGYGLRPGNSSAKRNPTCNLAAC